MRRNFCQACSFVKFGVKTRIPIPHTCGGNPGITKVKYQYIPTREALDKYLARLKELMEEDLALNNDSHIQCQKSTETENPKDAGAPFPPLRDDIPN